MCYAIVICYPGRWLGITDFTSFDIDYFVYKTCGSAWQLSHHVHPIYGMVIVLEGSATYWIDGQEILVRAGSFLLTRPGSTRQAVTTGMTCAAIDFSLRGSTLELPLVNGFSGADEVRRLISEFQYDWLQKGPGYELRCGATFLLLWHTLVYRRETAASNKHVERIKRHIVDHFAEPVRVEGLAKLVGLSPVYCGALFRKTQGITIAEFANRIRIHKAAALLEEGALDISETAYACGFSDVYYFSATFKRIVGLPPRNYREQPRRYRHREREDLLERLMD